MITKSNKHAPHTARLNIKILPLIPITVLLVCSSLSRNNLVHSPVNEIYQLTISALEYSAYTLATLLLLLERNILPTVIRNWPFWILGSYIFLSISWSIDRQVAALNLVQYIGAGSSVFLATQYLASSRSKISSYYWIAVFATIIVASLAKIILIDGIQPGRLRGLNGDPTTLSVDCMFSLWACLATIPRMQTTETRILVGAIAGLSGILLIGSKSATALITTVIISTLGAFLYSISRMSHHRRANVILLLLFMTAIFILTVMVSFESLVSSELITELFGKSPTYSGRLAIWREALSLIDQRPVFGWGFDYTHSIESQNLLWHNHYHNGYLDMIVRGGIIGLLFIVIMYTHALTHVRKFDTETFRDRLAYLTLVLGILIYSLTETTFSLWENKVWLVLLFSLSVLTISNRRQSAHSNSRRKRRRKFREQ